MLDRLAEDLVLAVTLLVPCLVVIAFLFDLYSILSHLSPESRTIEPWHVWLALIPVFNLAWAFIYGVRVPSSLRREWECWSRIPTAMFNSDLAASLRREWGVGRQASKYDFGQSAGFLHALLNALFWMWLAFLYFFRFLDSGWTCGIVGFAGLGMCFAFFDFWAKCVNRSNLLAQLRESYGPHQAPDTDYPFAEPLRSDAIRSSNRDLYR